MTEQPFFAVRVVIRHADGGSSQRDYVRGERHMGRDTFTSWALGDFIGLCVTSRDQFSVEVFEIDFATVAENRRYQHTTH